MLQGPTGATRLLLRALRAQDVRGRTLLDVGGGVGTIQHDLLAAGIEHAVGVDASAAYLAAAREEARPRGWEDRVTLLHGDFVRLANDVPSADIVTLDKVICCYDDMPSLLGAAAARSRRMLGAVFPRDTWWTRLGIRLVNFIMRLRRSPFRTFLHPPQEVDSVLRRYGLTPRWQGGTLLWLVWVYARETVAVGRDPARRD